MMFEGLIQYLAEGISLIISVETIFSLAVGVFAGVVGGAIPGITGTITMAILLPFTWTLSPSAAITMLLGIYCGGQYGGSIPAVLIGAPGTNSAAATVMDGFPLRNKGFANKGLLVSLLASVAGGMGSAVLLILLVLPLARFALSFGPPEYAALAIFGLTIIGSLSGKETLKGIMSGAFGLFLATIGVDAFTAQTRFTFGYLVLLDGVQLLPLMMGVFAVSQMFTQVISTTKGKVQDKIDINQAKITRNTLSRDELKTLTIPILIGIVVGTFIGVMPGAGASIACWVAYSEAKRFSKNKRMFGKGAIEGVAAPEAANNGVTGGALVPLLALGVPGSSSTAILVGAFMMHGLTPGPLLFRDNPALCYSIFIGLFVANLFLLLIGLGAIRISARVANLSENVLISCIFPLLFVGAFAFKGQIFSVGMMLLFGVVGFFMRRYKFMPAATVLGFILGFILESNMRRALILSQGSFSIFFTRPISAALIIVSILSFGFSVYREYKTKEEEAASEIQVNN
jgi:putative tricarboxylic transport membrane protein